MEPQRLQSLNDREPATDGRYVLYWMQHGQRADFNPALEFAVERANGLGQGLIVGFGLTESYPEANERHYAFMLQGLAEVREALHARGIKFVMRKGSPDEVALGLAQEASLVVCDRGYLRHERKWRERVAREARRQVLQVEGELVVPLEVASTKQEFAARTIRPKLQKAWPDFLNPVEPVEPETDSTKLDVTGDLDPRDPDKLLAGLDLDRSVGKVARFVGGTSQARRRLEAFLDEGLKGYKDARSDPAHPQSTNLSPYLHFGQISPVEVALQVQEARRRAQDDAAALLEELIVRRELSHNYVFYNPDYDRFAGLPDWARRTLGEHQGDDRPARYTRTQLENAETDDRYWNAAMLEMRRTGYMHNYMRMYWGKKILEWSNTPEHAHATALAINNKFFLDGRDANSFANVAWCFGLHDRPWQERPVFGKVRYMNANGLKRKFDIEAYCDWAEGLPDGGRAPGM